MKNLLIFIYILLSLNLNSQEHIKSIVFDNITPLWQHLVVDSSRLSDNIYKGTKHLRNQSKQLIIGDSIGYFIYVDISDDLQGAYIEKMDLKTGTLLWHNVFGLLDSGVREYPTYLYLNDKGNLEIICMRNIEKNFVLLWSLGQISIRKYDALTGHLLNHYYNNEELSDEEKLPFFPGLVKFYPLNDKYVYITPYTSPLFTTYFKIFDSKTNLESVNSLKRDSYYISGASNGPYLQNYKNLIYSRHSFKQNVFDTIKDENYDSMRFFIDYYNIDFDTIKSIELSDYFPYNWEISFSLDNNNYLFFVCKDSTSFFKTYTAYVFFDSEGNYIETLDFGRKNTKNLSIRKLPNQKGVLVFEEHNNGGNDEKSLDIWQSDGFGNLELLKKISFTEKRLFKISNIKILQNNNIIIHFVFWTPDPNQNRASLDRIIDIVAIDGNELGLINNQNEETKLAEIIVYPNPVKNILSIEFSSSFSGSIDILDELGRKIKILKLKNQITKIVDISELTTGIYFIKIHDNSNNKEYKVKRFIVK